MDTSELTPKERRALLAKLQKEENENKITETRAYEGIKGDFLKDLFFKVDNQEDETSKFLEFIKSESEAFHKIMMDYGKLKSAKQKNFSITNGQFKLEVKSQAVKRFDERAEVAAQALVEFLQGWIESKEDGAENPMYQLNMSLISKNRAGDFDNKKISLLYKHEESFNDPRYSEIMQMFRNAHTVDGTAIHYYFWKKDENQVWQRVELSFNKL